MSNVKVVKVDSLKIGGGVKKTKKNSPSNIDYLKNIVRGTKEKVQNKGSINLSDAQMIEGLLSRKLSKKNVEVRKAPQVTKKVPEPPKVPEVTKKVPEPPKVPEVTKKVPEPPKKAPEVKKKKRVKLPKKIGKKATKKEIISYFSKADQKKLRTKRDKKIISSNLVAPKIDKRTKKNLYKAAVKNILKKDKTARKELDKMTKSELLEVLSKNGIIDKESKAPTKILKDLYHLYLLTEVNVSK